MTAEEMPPELAALVDLAPVREAEAEIDHARLRYQDAADMARGAEAAVVEAHRVIPELTQRAVAGERVSAATVARAHQRARDAALYRDFCQEVARRLLPDEREAEGRLARARALAYAALLDRGVDLRIAAAARADRADGDVNRNTDHAERHAAKIDYEAASRIVHHAIRNGARFPGSVPQAMGLAMPSWPSTEYAERSYWNRPAPEGEMAA